MKSPKPCDTIPWCDLSPEQQDRFLKSYTSTATCEERTKHATEARELRFVVLLKQLSLPDNLAIQLGAEENLKYVQDIRSRFEGLISETILGWIRARDWRSLKWLTELVKKNPSGEFKAEDIRAKKNYDLKSVMVRAFMNLSNCNEDFLLFGAQSRPECLPTKMAFDSYVMGEYMRRLNKEKTTRSPKFISNLQTQIKRCRKVLGFDGLPEASEVK